jgi:carbon monoxide dehydrogenase subunit G
MGTTRCHTRIARDPEEVWAVITDPCSVTSWFPGVTACTFTDGIRTATTTTGMEVSETVYTNDSELHRFQYGAVPGGFFESQVATLDVVEDGEGSIVIFSVDATPDSVIPSLKQAYEAALASLKNLLEE